MVLPRSLELPIVAARFRDALVAGDGEAASAAIAAGIEAGLGLPELVVDVLAAAQREVGACWERGTLSVAQEHWATEVTLAELARLREVFPPRRELGATVVVAAPEGERHSLPARIVAALFAARGWRFDLLGGDVPTAELADWVAWRRPAVVALSVTVAGNLPAAATVAAAVAAIDSPPVLLVGGAAFGDPPVLPAGFPAAAVLAPDALAGVELAERLVAAFGPTLHAYLVTVGGRIQALRRRRGMSQAELGAAADLARSYVSAVEQGRQNITLDAALRLAAALRVGMGELLREDGEPPP